MIFFHGIPGDRPYEIIETISQAFVDLGIKGSRESIGLVLLTYHNRPMISLFSFKFRNYIE